MLPVFPVIVPLLTAAVLAGLTKIISQRVSQLISLGAAGATTVACALLMRASAAQPIVYWFGSWCPRQGIALGISFTVEPLGAGLAAFAGLLTIASLAFSSQYFDTVDNYFHSLLLAFLAAMCGFCLTGDLFNMFVFFELMSAAAFALCGYKTDDAGSVQGAFNFAVVNTIAAYFVVTGIGMLYARTGALNMAQMGRALSSGPHDSLVTAGLTFVIFGYLVKAAVVPFHFWLTDAHAVAPTPVCVLFSGVMVEMGLFAMARIWWDVFDNSLHVHLHALTNLCVAVGAVTAVVGSLMCWLQRSLKRLLAFSTVAHIGLITIGVGLFTPDGLAGASVYVLGHGMVKGGLFLVAGILLHRFEQIDECDLYGKGRGEPWTAAIFFAGALGLAGLPFSGLSSGSKLISESADSAGFPWVRLIALGTGSLTAAAVLRAGARVFLGWGPSAPEDKAPKNEEKPETKEGHEDTPLSMFFPAAALVITGLLLGLLPGLVPVARSAAVQFENGGAYAAHVLESQSMPASHPLAPIEGGEADGVLSVVAAVVIAAMFLFSPRVRSVSAVFEKPVAFLHRLHSGHPGDYVAFLTLGMASFGLICAYCLQ